MSQSLPKTLPVNDEYSTDNSSQQGVWVLLEFILCLRRWFGDHESCKVDGRWRGPLQKIQGKWECKSVWEFTSFTTCSGFCTDNWSLFCKKKHSVCRATSRNFCMHWSTPDINRKRHQHTDSNMSKMNKKNLKASLTSSNLLLVSSIYVVLAHQRCKTCLKNKRRENNISNFFLMNAPKCGLLGLQYRWFCIPLVPDGWIRMRCVRKETVSPWMILVFGVILKRRRVSQVSTDAQG